MNPRSNRLKSIHRKAVSVTELVVAIGLLAILASAIGQYVVYVNQAIRSRELFRMIHWELDSARELIGSWHPAEVTSQRIAAIPISQRLQQQLREPTWSVHIQPAQFQGLDRGGVKSVRLAIVGIHHGQAIQPMERLFWIRDEDRQVSQPNLPQTAKDDLSQAPTELERGD